MIEVLDTVASATCDNCERGIVQLQGDLGTKKKWVHAEGLKEWCANAPLATPREGTIR